MKRLLRLVEDWYFDRFWHDASCMTCNRYFNSYTRGLDCPHARVKSA